MATYTSPTSFTTSQNTLTQTSTTSASTTSLPPDLQPSNLDTLPVLTALLTRVQTTLNNPSSQSLPSVSPLPTSQSVTSQSSVDKNPYSSAPLTTKDIPIATDQLKHRLHRARVQVGSLPDVERSIAEQEEEITELEDKIRRQRDVLERLRNAGSGGRGDDRMET